jgi:hypothetical protein
VKPYKVRDIESALQKKGFLKKTTHHKLFYLCINDRITGIHTFISHGLFEYNDTLLSKMKHQMHLSGNELDAFIKCPLTSEEYVAILNERGIL